MNYTTGIYFGYIVDWDERIKNVTIEDIKEAANFVFQDQKKTIGYLLPESDKLKNE